ncbi:sulfotransferase [Conexibacter sp. JD483]|uniref:sulfotransferase family protein n=1 Tax=unclassified Conexibacter TaxID=2627773 RepID=UPI0027238A02|nr:MULTISPECIES: sulfotransferase family protein [unclassified Conexibacter]MDO8187443.1 sulfotransferase [Conexibacter sp. CPCC 205706]MDO8198677.1 sulfotransferase [Conexibacter sp. CPCC 205762]MDR9369855.1 sulfotransferase [Conexibacter sp. JD483]
MKVIGAGYGRTGTMSQKGALEQLGFGPCLHMIDVLRDPSLAAPWKAAAAGERVDWVAALDGWGSTIDWPACAFWEQHMEAFPDAKVLLSVRDKEAWHRSCLTTIYEAKEMAGRGELAGNTENAPAGVVLEMINGIIWDGTFHGRFLDKQYAFEVFDRHVAEVKAKVPADRLVVFEVSDGWGPLCEGLGVAVPDEPFPHLNDTAAFRQMLGMQPVSV